jgi:hypothetical protein
LSEQRLIREERANGLPFAPACGRRNHFWGIGD